MLSFYIKATFKFSDKHPLDVARKQYKKYGAKKDFPKELSSERILMAEMHRLSHIPESNYIY